MAQLRNLRAGGGYATEEERQPRRKSAVDDLSELDGALLAELMEDLPPSALQVDDAGDRLSHVVRSLEAEIVDGGKAAEAMAHCDELEIGAPSHDGGGRLEDVLMLSEIDEYEGALHWPEAPPLVDGWYVYMDESEGSIALNEAVDHQYYYAESSAEQVYIRLWD